MEDALFSSYVFVTSMFYCTGWFNRAGSMTGCGNLLGLGPWGRVVLRLKAGFHQCNSVGPGGVLSKGIWEFTGGDSGLSIMCPSWKKFKASMWPGLESKGFQASAKSSAHN